MHEGSAVESAREASKQLLARGVAVRAAELANASTRADAAVQLQRNAVTAAMQALSPGGGGGGAAAGGVAASPTPAAAAAPAGASLMHGEGADASHQQPTPTASCPGPSLAPPQQHAAAAVERSPVSLASATTAAGPLVLGSVEESAQAAQALQTLDLFDFKLYGQGFSAGAGAVPLVSLGHQVLYAPSPGETVDEFGINLAAAAAGASAGHSATATTGSSSSSSSGSPALRMQPLPAAAGASATPAAVAVGATAPDTAATSGSNSRSGRGRDQTAATAAGGSGKEHTLEQLLGQQRQQMSDQPAHLRQRHPKQEPAQLSQQQAALRAYPSPAAAIAAATRSPGSRTPAGSGARVTPRTHEYGPSRLPAAAAVRGSAGWRAAPQRAWQSLRHRAECALEGTGERLMELAAQLLLWAVQLLLVPIRALLGPWYRFNRQEKARSREVLAQSELDIPELMRTLGALPSWLAGIGGATEQLDWANALLAQVWPVLDPVVCELIRSTVEPLLSDMKPPFIAAMGFQRLTLGELPVKLQGLRVVGAQHQGAANVEGAAGGRSREAAAVADAADDRLELEVDFVWIGEPNISFFVEMALAGPAARLVPKVSNLSARGTLRIGLARLLPQLPGFGALLVSLARTPQVKFTLDFGPALGGKVTAKPVAAFLDPFIRDTLASMLVWPNRFVVPLLPREVTGNVDDLALHSVGVLEVDVMSAHRLPKKGMLSSVDPQVEVWTQPQHRCVSSVMSRSRNPKWHGQLLEVLVQEPDSQQLRVVVSDIDSLNLKELLRANLLKGAAGMLRSANPIGRTAVSLRDICGKPFERQELELRLSGSEWAYELGVVGEDDTASLKLALTYKPFRDLDASSSAPIDTRGVLFVDIRQCRDLASEDWAAGSSDPYVLLKVAGQQQQTVVVPHSLSPVYNAHFEFYHVRLPDTLAVQVWDRDTFKPDDLLGEVQLPVKTIVTWAQCGKRGWRDGWWRLGKPKGGVSRLLGGGKEVQTGADAAGAGRIEMKVQFRPYTSGGGSSGGGGA